MPTTRQRHTITETESVQRALVAAERRWPGKSRQQLILELVAAGHASIERDADGEAERWQRVLRRTGKDLAEAYPLGYLDELREDWPE